MTNVNDLESALFETGGIIDTLATFASIVFVFVAAYYIFTSATNAKALRMAGYKHAWIAWIPYLRHYAIADATKEEGTETEIYGRWKIPNAIYTLWWVALILMSSLDSGLTFWLPSSLVAILDFILSGLFLGGAYGRMYEKLENRTTENVMAVAIWSGVFPIVAAFKFLKYKEKSNSNSDEETKTVTVSTEETHASSENPDK